jgi:Na+/H+ antiporter NhaC
VAIVLAVATRQVIVSLALGIFTASAMICAARGEYNPLRFVEYAVNHFLLGVLARVKPDGSGVDNEHLTILLYTILMGAMIGVVSASGGTRAVVARVTRRMRTRRGAQLGAGLGGLGVFFDDYASPMIVGPGLQPIFDRQRLSREKLAFLVNWTAAPDSSIFLSTWLAVQISWIHGGFDQLAGRMPAFLEGATAANTFWATIPYRTYTLLALAMVFLVALTGRDFGAMRRCESRRAAEEEAPAAEPQPGDAPDRWILGAAPIAVLVGLTVGLMVATGWSACRQGGMPLAFDSVGAAWRSLETLLGRADSHFALLYASLGAAVTAVGMTVVWRALSLARTMEAAVGGMSHMFAASIILVLAWGLSAASRELELGIAAEAFLRRQIEAGVFSVHWLPVAVFLTACVLSFSTGTSWGTMGILLPPVVTIAGGLLAGLPPDEGRVLFHASVGAAMAGAVFGNTCSPLADVTVLSSMFSGCELAAHVRTVLPYAVVTAAASIACSDGARWALRRWAPAMYPHWNAWYGLAAGVLLLLLVLLLAGRRPPARPAPAAE